jgi:hypothetical protein
VTTEESPYDTLAAGAAQRRHRLHLRRAAQRRRCRRTCSRRRCSTTDLGDRARRPSAGAREADRLRRVCAAPPGCCRATARLRASC